jgi:hypothetical protein
VTIGPDSRIPAVAPSTESPPQVTIARAYRPGSGNTPRSTTIAAGATMAAPTPCPKRAAARSPKFAATGPAAEAAANTASPVPNIRRPPNRSASRPPNSSSPLNGSPYAALSSTSSDRFRPNSWPIAGSGTAIRVIVKTSVAWTVPSSAKGGPERGRPRTARVRSPAADRRCDLFAAAQDLLAARGRGPGEHKRHRTRRPYVLRGAVICGVCERRMQGQWSNERPYYRCRFPEEHALANRIAHPRNVYLREDWLTEPSDAWLAQAFAPHRLNGTRDARAAADHDEAADAAARAARRTITECDTKLARYRVALDSGADPAVVTAWIAQTQPNGSRPEPTCAAAPAAAR